MRPPRDPIQWPTEGCCVSYLASRYCELALLAADAVLVALEKSNMVAGWGVAPVVVLATASARCRGRRSNCCLQNRIRVNQLGQSTINDISSLQRSPYMGPGQDNHNLGIELTDASRSDIPSGNLQSCTKNTLIHRIPRSQLKLCVQARTKPDIVIK